MLLRNSVDADIPTIQAIYAHWVGVGTGSFELEPPTVEEITRRRTDVLDKNLPYIVAEQDGKVAGYAYANWFRPRPAYRFSVENSVYVHPDVRRGAAVDGRTVDAVRASRGTANDRGNWRFKQCRVHRAAYCDGIHPHGNAALDGVEV
jgi:Acetyltransferase (GNAT) family